VQSFESLFIDILDNQQEKKFVKKVFESFIFTSENTIQFMKIAILGTRGIPK
jgi:hypothetical protein